MPALVSLIESTAAPEEASFPSGVFTLPQNDADWSVALVDVKWLCLNQQYKQCASRCHHLLKNAPHPIDPIRATYLYYYAATSYECLGRAAHIFSTFKIPFLSSAMENFESANAALPAALPHPVLNPRLSYSPVTDNPYSCSPTSQFDLSPLPPSGFIWSPTGSPTRRYIPGSGDGAGCPSDSPSVRIWSPPTYSPVQKGSPVGSIMALPYRNRNTSLFQTPPPAPAFPVPSPSACSSITTAFCVTPPLEPEIASRRPDDAPIPVFNLPPPTCAAPPPPHVIFNSPASSVREQLARFDSDKDGLPIGKKIVKNIARMIDHSLITASDDPFISRERSTLRPGMRPPVRLSPVKFPPDLKDPVKQFTLIPSPLKIRKLTGEVLKCGGPGIVIRENATQDEKEGPNRPPTRVRPPRLPLRIIPSKMKADTEDPKPQILSPQPKRISPILPMAYPYPPLSPSSMPNPPATPSPILQRTTPVLASPFKFPEIKSSVTSYPPPIPSPHPVSPTRAAQIIKFDKAVLWLREHIPSNTSHLSKEIQHVSELQKARARHMKMSRSASFGAFTPDKASAGESVRLWDAPNVNEYGDLLRVEARGERVKRLREEGWKIGIRSKHSLYKGKKYYDELCETALAELGDGRGLTVEGNGSLREW